MEKKAIQFQIKGMRQDLSISHSDPNYAYEIINMRLTPMEGGTMLALVNEKGNTQLPLLRVSNTDPNLIIAESWPQNTECLGHCVINSYLVLFLYMTLTETSLIICIDFSRTVTSDSVTGYPYRRLLETTGEDGLNFSTEHLIETIADYETEKIIKVYFTDGYNQPRVINIAEGCTYTNVDSLNFVRTLQNNEIVSISKKDSPGALFSSGVIQYCLSYYSLHMQESNIFYTSPLYYISSGNRGGRPDETIGNAFQITVNNADTHFDFLRIYSIRRTSLDTMPIVKRVADVKVPSSGSIIYTDTNTTGEEIDPTLLYYIGGEPISAGTFEAKDGTLFLGNLKLKKRIPRYPDDGNLVEMTSTNNPLRGATITLDEYERTINSNDSSAITYNYETQLYDDSSNVTMFKANENYRLGFQLQHKSGAWTDAFFIDDYMLKVPPITSTNGDTTIIHTFLCEYNNQDVIASLVDQGFVQIRPLIVYPKFSDRHVLCQGVVSPTVYNLKERYDNTTYAQASWFVRPFPMNYPGGNEPANNEQASNEGTWYEYRHNVMLRPSNKYGNEIQSMDIDPQAQQGHELDDISVFSSIFTSSNTYNSKYSDYYFVDNSIVTLNCPEIEFDKLFSLQQSSNLKFRIVGIIPINSTTSDISIIASAPFEGTSANVLLNTTGTNYQIRPSATGEIKIGDNIKKFSFSGTNGWKTSPVYPYWIDKKLFEIKDATAVGDLGIMRQVVQGINISPWHKTGQLSTTPKRSSISSDHLSVVDSEYYSSIIESKKLSHYRFSNNTYYFTDNNNNSWMWKPSDSWSGASNKDVCDVLLYNSEEPLMEKINVPEYGYGKYFGNIDKLIVSGTRNGNKYLIRGTSSWYTAPVEVQKNVSDDEMGTFLRLYGYRYPGTWALNHDSVTNNGYNDVDSSYNAFLNYSRISYTYDYEGVISAFNDDIEYASSSDGILMKYKSTPHIVISMNGITSVGNTNNPVKTILPYIGAADYISTSNCTTNSIDNTAITTSDGGHINNLNMGGYLFVGEIWNEENSETNPNLFGGTSEEALIANDWTIGGYEISLLNGASPVESFTLEWDRGDTYYQRYDCLKTYPYTLEDTNSIVEVVSFMCETRVNIDGRYDRNRGTASVVASPTNFNLYNPVYSQKDNFFIYHGHNSVNDGEEFPTQITWTTTKFPNALIDKWTNVTLAATLNLDGDRGDLNRLEKFRNDLYAFQEKGVAKISFNEKTLLSTQEGIPVEIANSNRVEGKQYLTELEGLTNKLSIKVTPNGIYFVDGKTKTAHLFNGQQCLNLSDTKAMKVFFESQSDDIILSYDSKEKDLYFINGDKCLCYSEKLGEFAGFFSYEGCSFIENINGESIYSDKDENLLVSFKSGNLWAQNEGNYNSYFGAIKPFSITFLATDNLPTDKVFTNLDFTADSYLDDTFVTTKTFDRLKVWNEYQTGEISLVNTLGFPSNLKKKFRIWRANLPRAAWNGRDRMRNPWCYVQLRMDNPSRYKTILNTAMVDYFI